MSRDLVEIVHDLRQQLAKRGDASVRTLARAFAVNDSDKSGYFDFTEFETILGRVGIFLKRQELTKVFRYFDTNQDERINYTEFLIGVQGSMNGRRTAIVQKAFEKADVDGSGVIDMKDVVNRYDATRHPQVLSGQKSNQQVLNEFLNAFEGAGGNNDGKVTLSEWINYYAGISASIPYNDDYFVLVVERAWGISEAGPSKGVALSLRRKILNVMREKIRQKTRADRTESETLRKVFKFFDQDDSGLIARTEFKSAMERFGMHLEPHVEASLFSEFDANGDNVINYNEFIAVLYETETMTLSFGDKKTDPDLGRTDYLESSGMIAASGGRPQRVADPSVATAKVIFIMGGPGAGKSSQAARVAREMGFVHVDVGYLLEMEAQHGQGAEAKAIQDAIKAGMAVPVSVTVTLIKKAIEDNVQSGKQLILLDGFPRNGDNIREWQSQCADFDIPFVLFLDAPVEVLRQRLSDSESKESAQSIASRLAYYNDVTLPLAKFFADNGKLAALSAVATPEEVYEQVRTTIRERLS